MQFIKQLGKQLGFVVLIGSAIFSASSASAQISVTIGTNTDVIFDPAYVRTLFPSNPTQVDLILLGGVHKKIPDTAGNHLTIDAWRKAERQF